MRDFTVLGGHDRPKQWLQLPCTYFFSILAHSSFRVTVRLKSN